MFHAIWAIHDAGNEKLAKSIRATLKEHNLGKFAQSWRINAEDLEALTPCEFLLGVENALSLPKPQTQGLKPQAPTGARELRPINWEGLFDKVKETIHINGAGFGQEQKDAIVKDLKAHVRVRQQVLAAELMRQRDSTVQAWKDKLGWKE